MNPTLTEPQRSSLYFRAGSSDKEYHATLEPAGDRFVVNFAYGRRGSTLSTGTKTNAPVDYHTAQRLFAKLVAEKKSKGYTEGPNGTPYRHTDHEDRSTGLLPQLLNAVEEAAVTALLNDPKWCAQEKFDGRRVLLRKSGSDLTASNRKGLAIGLGSALADTLELFPGSCVLDGECVGDNYHAFDLLELDSRDLRLLPYERRLAELLNLLASVQQRNIRYAPTAFTAREKRDALDTFRREHREGIVFKRLDAPYTPGRPNSGGTQLKHKFVATLSAVVATVNAQRSVELKLIGRDGWLSVGNVTIPPNHPVPKVGTVVEARYLYAFPESSALYQPVYLGVRSDVDAAECMTAQLKFKPALEAEE